MGQITYKPAPGEAQSTTFRGIRLEAGKSVNIKDAAMLRKLNGHPQFDVSMNADEEEAAAATARDPNAGSVQTIVAPSHPSYYSTGGGAAATDDQEALGALQVTPLPPSAANAAGGGLNGPTLGDSPSVEQIRAAYGTDNPLESLQPGEPIGSVEVTGDVQKAQQDAQEVQQAQADAPPRRGRPRS